VDTATGACAPVEEYSQLVKAGGGLFIVDGVCATGGIPERMDAWGIDVVLTAAQKCLGAPPGLSLLVLSEKAMAKRRGLPSVPAYYADLLNWLPVMQDPTLYFSTPPVNEIRALHEALRVIGEEGTEQRFKRHDRQARALRAALTALGFVLFTEEPFLASTISVAVYPEEVDDQAFRAALYENGVVVAGGLGDTKGRVFRMGHMGNLTPGQIEFAVGALEETLSGLEYGFDRGAGLAAARKVLSG
jgi:alanine-glyoxylate transaminase/serine-glyoxylate transaminase/serine-pyruvate transaminase